MKIEDYRLLALCEIGFEEPIWAILLHKDVNVDAFQKAIDDARVKYEEEIDKNGNDWEYISRDLGNFDYVRLGFNGKLYY